MAAGGITRFLEARCRARGAAPCLVFRDRVWSYDEVLAACESAAAGLEQRGLQRGQRMAVLLPNGPEAIFVWMAAARLGAITAPLHPQLTTAEIRTMLAWLEQRMPDDSAVDGALKTISVVASAADSVRNRVITAPQKTVRALRQRGVASADRVIRTDNQSRPPCSSGQADRCWQTRRAHARRV